MSDKQISLAITVNIVIIILYLVFTSYREYLSNKCISSGNSVYAKQLEVRGLRMGLNDGVLTAEKAYQETDSKDFHLIDWEYNGMSGHHAIYHSDGRFEVIKEFTIKSKKNLTK